MADHRSYRTVAILVGAFLLPFFCFPTLYEAHEYYAIANGVFLLMAVALLIPKWSVPLIVAVQLFTFWTHYNLRPDYDFTIPAAIMEHTKPNDVVIIYGQEWSPWVPYYAHRRAIMETTLAPLDDVVERGMAITHGAVLRCPCKWDGDPRYEAIFQRLQMPPFHGTCQLGWRLD